ncbi:MAG: NAD-dependent epimerase/dehydratase family protein [Verrucomicrobia bacterium]|nr:NAD-dependent epimerase/dehydratase family protein [Verrucomicrobiota bacterium]
MVLPEHIHNEAELEDVLTRPSQALVELAKTLTSPLVVLGAGGKMGPSLAVLARRAAEAAGQSLDVVAVSRFRDEPVRQRLEANGVQTVSLDLLEARSLESLPDAENLIYLVGLKFGTSTNPAGTWAVNTLVPSRLLERYPQARVVALSTGNVYPLVEVRRGGSVETDPLTPHGEYANAAVGRERIFEYAAARQGTRVALLRLFYATELRYGVLVDLARKVQAGEAIPLATGYLNCIWLGDANDMTLRALRLAAAPPSVWNLCRPEMVSVRDAACRLGDLLGRRPLFTGAESPTALLGDPRRICGALGPPATDLATLLEWTARWVSHGGRDLGRPTHFEVRDGKY